MPRFRMVGKFEALGRRGMEAILHWRVERRRVVLLLRDVGRTLRSVILTRGR